MLGLRIMCAASMFGHTPQLVYRTTLTQAQALLKIHPELQAGFTSLAVSGLSGRRPF
jgi:hypothetical protein